ncbi:putative very-long-chain 3-oxoacyl-CoA reductase [Rosa chinensis]|uniref:Putative very-long-chain 3-oxoacyl-CoA reductase n=1 Tax=Rosa chinensis TaxID=74649 RepID=A0A2P6R0V2_ROSCH|nr:very-long-chain 3-oxoacyl-CoA reductase 1-like [Rosa chinensis]XP_040373294.1 very-long-chain 3-oxoacyl-CoA reductase 1-like [Rosa chinensis]XP_040373295.1 very-long-chain 3-oxoacyl-CoA reductase 1-like [Rosa chinensis]XP_040373296.1 very-long-chain 3-oxoacyl-CoA reductase 1-like [Rosa chinensis]XP_040373297.1 very-long-chain 3-oxoacyl-CoA reductase 1-like [Rosa chinensis]XP_040373298.1 very-long-chain 3-oxoacyl-CoA reductase 1-like [Rosa chinensis]XP_040373299.1 very-long-chain 3-oxoacyl-
MELQEFFIVAAITIGFLSVCKSLINFVRWVWVMFLRPPRNLKEYGSWAIITGSTDGIGKALAFEMASKGLNLVLVGRNPSKLEATSNGIRGKYFHEQVKVKSIVIDLAKLSGEEIARTIEEGIKGLDVGILINNAGMTYPYARFFHEVDLELMEGITKVNMEAPSWVTRAVLPGMLKKKKGAIINIGSDLSEDPSLPLYTLYAASKSYLKMFSRCISLEYKQHGIDIQCQAPRFVSTEMTKNLKSLPVPLLIASLEKFSKASIRWIGYDHLCNPYWSHSVQGFMIHACPDVLINALSFWMCSTVRKRGQMKERQ